MNWTYEAWQEIRGILEKILQITFIEEKFSKNQELKIKNPVQLKTERDFFIRKEDY